jgi:hypothetical protein
MGGDGGVIASNRRYMRGAGTADHTGDYASSHDAAADPAVQRHQTERVMRYCAVSQQPLFPKRTTTTKQQQQQQPLIVACPYGRLYFKEEVVEALLKRKQHQTQETEDGLGHIRGLKDLREARFHFANDTELVPTCPISGRELNGHIPAYVLQTVTGDDSASPCSPSLCNVVSEYGLQMLGKQALAQEYGCQLEDKWRLAPPPAILELVQHEWQEKIAGQKKRRKKRARAASEDINSSNSNTTTTTTSSSSARTLKKKLPSVSEAVRARVSVAVQSNKVLSSLFTTADKL